MTDENFEDTHWDRTELQYFYIPKLVDAVNNGCLPSTALHMVDEWDFWGECDREDGFDVDWFEVGKDHTVIFFNFPEPQQIPEALYGAVLVNNITGKAKYYTLEYGYLDSWLIGNKTLKGHCNYGTLDSRERSAFMKWVTDRIADPK